MKASLAPGKKLVLLTSLVFMAGATWLSFKHIAKSLPSPAPLSGDPQIARQEAVAAAKAKGSNHYEYQSAFMPGTAHAPNGASK